MSEPPRKQQKLSPYTLHYWGGIPGRGEYIRLAFESTHTPYTEVNNPQALMKTLHKGSPSHFAPPVLELPSGELLSQTGAILNYLAPRLGLAGEKGSLLKGVVQDEEQREAAELERAWVNQLVLTGLDWCVEAHDTHHPIASQLYYEDQLPESLRRAEDFRTARIPKFLAHFDEVLSHNHSHTHLVGGKTTTADLVLFHVLEGVEYAFPKRMAQLKGTGRYDRVWALKERVEGEGGVKEYIESGRRKEWGMGLFRYYPELDGEVEEEGK